MSILSRLLKDFQIMIQLFMKCLVFLQSQETQLKQGQKLKATLTLSVSRSVIITSYFIYLKKMNDLDKALKVNVQDEVLTTLRSLILLPTLDQQVFDV